MTDKIEAAARESAEDFAESVDAETGATICKGSYMNGYLAGHASRDAEVAALLKYNNQLQSELAMLKARLE